ncbi:MAG: non-canonical purine NTP diphosphatase [Bacteroidales bacterium]|jgi:XTP/dITP diphosphohydrolase|nr:non-canonical purine NTP diphosphatase [Bacteroidales bacterium]MDD3690668.1 non-canonical purine NTP diphosphatase [Bacteroidales bacterium]MDD4043832.1 non-canonical purine NTP diphosphatase [Bacteroidales bacterium]MDX9890009.1 non-canonical purine NTP diphosphatase [Bacteroidales bacterium]
MQLIFATNNAHKLYEVKSILDNHIKILSLNDINCKEDIPETADTLEGNALQKAQFIYHRYHQNCFADDTGLEIEALNGRPGVYSARYAGENCNFNDNMNKVLNEMQGISHRKACFRTVIALLFDGKEYLFEGKVEGEILVEKKGLVGFGYDPIFQPDGYHKTFAEMDILEKNRISHRGLSIQKLVNFLKTLQD